MVEIGKQMEERWQHISALCVCVCVCVCASEIVEIGKQRKKI
jgi:hypothetical protein